MWLPQPSSQTWGARGTTTSTGDVLTTITKARELSIFKRINLSALVHNFSHNSKLETSTNPRNQIEPQLKSLLFAELPLGNMHFPPPSKTHRHTLVVRGPFDPFFASKHERQHHVESDDAWYPVDVTIPTCSPVAFWCSCSVLLSFWWWCRAEVPLPRGWAVSLRSHALPLWKEETIRNFEIKSPSAARRPRGHVGYTRSVKERKILSQV